MTDLAKKKSLCQFHFSLMQAAGIVFFIIDLMYKLLVLSLFQNITIAD